MTTLTLTSDLPKISCIEIPGTVLGVGNKAINALGGIEALSKVLGKKYEASTSAGCLAGKFLQSGVFLRCNPDDRFSKFIGSGIQQRSDILIKVRRNKRTGCILSCTAVGIIKERVTFEFMSDFYCTPPETTRNIKLKIDEELNEDTTDPIFIPPAVFTRIVVPFNYKFENNLFAPTAQYFTKNKIKRQKHLISRKHALKDTPKEDAGNNEQSIASINEAHQTELSFNDTTDNLESSSILYPEDDNISLSDAGDDTHNSLICTGRKTAEDSYNATCRYAADEVPIKPTPAALNISVDQHLLDCYIELFKSRPVWLRVSLDCNIPSNITFWKRKPVLGRTCYLFWDGPWRGTLCRLGYDPRQDPESRIYQTIDFRDSYFRTVTWKTSSSGNNPRINTNMNSQKSLLTESLSSINSSLSSVFQVPNKQSNAEVPPVAFVPKTIRQLPGSMSKNDVQFKIAPKHRSQLFQLCDIDDQCVQQLLKTTQHLDVCCKESGWFPRETLTKIRDLMRMASKRMRNDEIQSITLTSEQSTQI